MQNFGTEYKKLNSQQRQAVDTIDGPLLVVAGPGTGKTQLLSLRVANILRKTDANAGNILCLTYTESGQAAMRARLQSLIGNDSKQVQIHTFHGFGTFLITRYNEYFPDLMSFRAADDLALYEVLRSCFEKLPRGKPLAGQAYGQFIYQKAALERISQLKQAGLTPKQTKATLQSDLAWCQGTAKKLIKAFTSVSRFSIKILPGLKKQLEPLLGMLPESGSLAESCLGGFSQALAEVEASGKTSALSAFKKKWFSSEAGELYFKPADQLAKLEALADLYESYEAALKRRKLLDYNDMLLYALERLEANKELRAAVQETFHFILADEYQDTNAAQARLIELIADNPVNENRPNVMVVGDDDQAIYGFQGALGEALVRFRERWRDVTTITLKDNYRSTQPILDTARAVISQGQSRLENYYEDIDKTLQAHAQYHPKQPVAVQTSSHGGVLDYAAELAQNAPGELAIIAPKHKYLAELAAYLDAKGVAYQYAGRENLLGDELVANTLLVAETSLAISQSHDKHSDLLLPLLLASGILNVSRTSAWQIAINAHANHTGWWQTLVSTKLPDTKHASERLEALSNTLEAADALVSLRQAASIVGKKRGLVPKLRALVGHAETYLGRNQISLADLLRYVELCRQAGVALPEPVVRGTPKAQVHLLTAHKSKGLEFEHVVALHADSFTWLEEKGQRNIIGLPSNWSWLQPATETRDDRLRLIYVVLTRAKQSLQVVLSTTSRSGRNTEPLPGTEILQALNPLSSSKAIDIGQDAKPLWYDWYRPANKEEQLALKQLLKRRLQDFSLSPSTLTMFLDVVHGGPAAFLVKVLLAVPTLVPPETRFGSYVHGLLGFSQGTLNRTGTLPIVADLKGHLSSTLPDLQAAEVDYAANVVASFLKHTDVIKPGGVPEYSFSDQHLSVDNVPLTGTVDRYGLDGNELVITDYKTGRALDSWQVSEDYYQQKLLRFRQQLLLYELLFRSSPKFKGVSLYELKIAFVEQRKRGGYTQLTLHADDTERQQLRALMQTIWQHILNVDFPDISGYKPAMPGVQAFIDDLLTKKI